MATVNKDFRIKSGLVVEGANGTINGSNIITEDAITGGTQTNVSVTYDANSGVINFVAENGIADSTTDDLQEGSSNLYFTNQRAIDAVGGSATSENTPNTVVKRDALGNFTAGDITATYFNVGLYDGGVISGGNGEMTLASGTILANATNGIQLNSNGGVFLNASGNIAFNSANVYVGPDLPENEVATAGDVDAAKTTAIANAAQDATAKADAALASANLYTDGKVSDLVGAAPELLNTLNELSAAIGDDANYATTVTNLVATKADTSYVDANFVNVADLPGQLDEYIPLTQKAQPDGVATLDATGQVPSTQLGNVSAIIDTLTTTEIEEGASLYFTDARAVAAIEAVVPSFTAVEVGSVAKQIAATASAFATLPSVAYSWAKSEYRSAEFLVRVSFGTHTEISKILLTLDTADNIAISEYGVVGTNGSLSDISAQIAGSNVELVVVPGNDSQITVFGTLLA